MIKSPEPVGYYDWGFVHVAVYVKLNWFQRKMAKWFFGWGWVENPNYRGE